MRRGPVVFVTAVVVWLALLSIVVVVVLVQSIQSTNGVHTLLLNGKTASAVSAKKTARIVKGIQAQLDFDHKQTQGSEQRLNAVVRQVETHLDQTIRSAITETAAAQSRTGSAELATVIAEIENNFDSTIRATVSQAASDAVQRLGH